MYRASRTSARPPAMVRLPRICPEVTIDRRDTDESSDTAAVELAELRQISDQSVCGDIANTRN